MRGTSIVSSSANADRDEERNVNPAGWPSTAASSPTSARRWPQPLESLERAFCPGKILYTALGGTVRRGPTSAAAKVFAIPFIHTLVHT